MVKLLDVFIHIRDTTGDRKCSVICPSTSKSHSKKMHKKSYPSDFLGRKTRGPKFNEIIFLTPGADPPYTLWLFEAMFEMQTF